MRLMPENACVLKLFEIYEEKNKLILILELMEGKSLEKFIKTNPNLSENQIYDIFYQILKSVSFLHSNGIMHRDIKPDNILFSKEKELYFLKMADFSLADNFFSLKTFKAICGTPGFMAPEIFSGNGYDEKVDIYSLGLVLYTL